MIPHVLTDLPPGMLGQLHHTIVSEPGTPAGGMLPGERSLVWAVVLVAACAAVVLCLHG
ncbi:hypothetical protein HLB44_35820 [Aquincola sp. S2]|uniref:Uncharacterized protein n=1 Tax=Pseudaquabacterium terrae TaxID=2732868 RepID=A0ABX2EUE3_9BURK|nr:hypothetical protein [Aquabacterium terrae]NRF72360.1 hypothetical protein [Aquabacterium terrae]